MGAPRSGRHWEKVEKVLVAVRIRRGPTECKSALALVEVPRSPARMHLAVEALQMMSPPAHIYFTPPSSSGHGQLVVTAPS